MRHKSSVRWRIGSAVTSSSISRYDGGGMICFDPQGSSRFSERWLRISTLPFHL